MGFTPSWLLLRRKDRSYIRLSLEILAGWALIVFLYMTISWYQDIRDNLTGSKANAAELIDRLDVVEESHRDNVAAGAAGVKEDTTDPVGWPTQRTSNLLFAAKQRYKTQGHDTILKKWKDLVARAPPTAVPFNETDLATIPTSRVYKHLLEMYRFRSKIPFENANAELGPIMVHDIKEMERSAMNFITYGDNDGLAMDRMLEVTKNSKAGGRGIVVVAGDKQYRLLMHLLSTLRGVLKSTLPVEVYYRGKGDLSKDQIAVINGFKSVVTKDLLAFEHLWNETEAGLSDAGFALKPFALLSSEFSEPILCDADVIFLQDPRVLYDDPDYRNTGTLYFRDRIFPSEGTRPYVKGLYKELEGIQEPSHELNASAWWHRGRNTHMQESGVVLIDKFRDSALLSFLFATWMNAKRQREILKEIMWGDKETYWVASEILQQPYAFAPLFAGAIGKLETSGDSMYLDSILHFDHSLKPLWLNGGLLLSKRRKVSEWLDVDAYGFDDGKWNYNSGKHLLWLYTNATFVKDKELGKLVKKMTDLGEQVDKTFKLN